MVDGLLAHSHACWHKTTSYHCPLLTFEHCIVVDNDGSMLIPKDICLREVCMDQQEDESG